MTDETTHLRALLADATARAEKAEAELVGALTNMDAEFAKHDQTIAQRNAAEAALGIIELWTHEYGAALKPPGADTYGEGKRDAKNEVAAILRGTK